jgi:mRNA interferase HigB
MRIISRKAIREASTNHSEWAALNAWYKIANAADCENFEEIRDTWNNCDKVGKFVVFDISHNKCRLIATINYQWKMIYIRNILRHSEYDRRDWQNQ